MKPIMTVILIIMLPSIMLSATLTVTNTNDVGAGSLRQAITDANSLFGPDIITFDIPTSDPNYNSSTGVWTIAPLSDLPMITGGYTTIDASTQTTNQGNTNAFGPEISFDGSNTLTYAFRIVSPNNTVKGFIFGNCDFAIQIFGTAATGNIITQNYIGTDATGTIPFSNNHGIGISGNASDIEIIDNTISGNTIAGIAFSPANNITITGNKIGTDVSGMFSIPNSTGIILDNSHNCTIGGTTYSVRNIISGNSNGGILITGSESIGNNIFGNFIGTNINGTDTIPNGNGVMLVNAANNIVGGLTVSHRNIISGNIQCGILLNGTGTNNNTIIGNYIGTDSLGTNPLSNLYGVIIKADADNNIVGGSNANARNVISANWEIGVYIEASDSNTVSGNYIGTDFTGTTTFYIGGDTLIQANGVEINTFSKYNLIGGSTPEERNIISGNRVYGAIYYGQVSKNNIAGNYIGTDVTGTYAIPNATGICVDDASNNNTMENNLLSGNISYGLFIVTTGSNNNIFRGNLLGTNATGTDTIPNDVGLLIAGGAKYNIIGGYNSLDRNIFSGNRYGGIELTDNGTDYNEIIGNFIGTDFSGNAPLANQLGIGIASLSTGTKIENNVISGNKTFGLILTDNTNSNTVVGNLIGLGIDGITELGNGASGIALTNGAKNNIIGSVSNGNTIAYNDSAGIVIVDNTTINNKISANFIFNNNFLGIDIFPAGVNANDVGDTDNGPNNMMNFPVIITSGYDLGTGNTFITGILDTQNPQNSTVEIFKAEPDLFFNHGEGKIYLGSTTPDASGNWSIMVTGLVDGDEITTTATDQNDNTSEFSSNKETIVGIDKANLSLLRASLFPNPTNNSTVIFYDLQKPSYVEIVVLDYQCKKVLTVYKGNQNKGEQNIKLQLDESLFPSGIYFVRINIDYINQTVLKLNLIK
ncbi:MAG: hypothetical protein PHP52_10730 [Bacteroidales bacterium]|nr:hypothetical protein [Bacteroidales bacterium]MDD4217130.1 hypothetical protein [Bacteroidales bacterium]